MAREQPKEPASVHSSPHFRNVGIDKRFIEQNADAMNRQFNRIYDEHRMNGGRSLSDGMVAPPQPMTYSTQASPVMSSSSSSGADMGQVNAVVAEAVGKLSAEIQDAFSRAFAQVLEQQKAMEQKISHLEGKLNMQAALAASAPAHSPVHHAPVEAPQAAQMPQPTKASEDDEPMVDRTQQISAHVAPEVRSQRQAEHEKLKDTVSIDKIFNFSGGRRK